MKRFHWEWLIAIILGLVAGLTYAWVVAPVRDEGTAPNSLRSDFRDEFRSAIASAYSSTGDLERARARLALLGDADSVQALSAQAQRALAAGQPFGRAQELARLASDLHAGFPSIPSFTSTAIVVVSPSLTSAPGPTSDLTSTAAVLSATPGAVVAPPATLTATQPSPPTRTPMPSPSVPFQLASRENVCDAALPEGLLQVTVLDRGGQPLPGIEITITWSQGEERFFTGFQPEISGGYADYVMQAGTSYSVQLARLGVPVSGLMAPLCPGTAGKTFVGGQHLTFREP